MGTKAQMLKYRAAFDRPVPDHWSWNETTDGGMADAGGCPTGEVCVEPEDDGARVTISDAGWYKDGSAPFFEVSAPEVLVPHEALPSLIAMLIDIYEKGERDD